LLSFDLNIGGNDIIIDPGAYLYTSNPEQRNLFRSTSKHNTLMIDGEEQNMIADCGPFQLDINSDVEKFYVNEKYGMYVVVGSYRLIGSDAKHQRSFKLIENQMIIEDVVDKKGKEHQLQLFFHFAPGLTPILDNNTIRCPIGDSFISMVFSSGNDYIVSIVEDTVSPSYGVLEQSKTVCISLKFNDRIKFLTTTKW